MKTIQFNTIGDLADYLGLESITTTSSITGYPENLYSNNLIGFDTIDQANEVAAQYNGEVVLFTKRDGWHFWNNKGRVYEPLTVDEYVQKLGDDYKTITHINEEDDFITEQMAELAELEDFEGAAALQKARNELKDVLEKCPENHSVVCVTDQVRGCAQKTYCYRFCEYKANEMMSYHEDVTTYTIGVGAIQLPDEE